MKKILSVVLSMLLVIGSLPVTVFSIDVDLDFENFVNNDISFEEFSTQAMDLMKSEEVSLFSDDTVEDDVEPDTNRLIVKSKKNEIDTFGAVGYVNGYEDLHILQYEDDEDCDEALAFYKAQSYVEYVQEDSFCEAEEAEAVEEVTLANPMQSVSDQFGYTALETYLNDNNIKYTEEIVIAVVDSGIANDHEYLKDKVQPTGFNSINPEGDCYDDRGHGTHVAGIIAANTHDNVVIKPYKVLDNKGVGTELQVYLGIEQAINDGADIINLSLSRRGESEILHEVIKAAYDAGIITVVSAGNKGISLDEVYFSPASFDEVVTVMSCGNSLYVSDFSNYGSKCQVTAPGENIVSTHLDNTYKALSGTSMSAPFISSAIAYILSAYPEYNFDDVVTKINENTKPCMSIPAGRYINALWITRSKEYTAYPDFSFTKTVFSEPFDLTISCKDEGAEIYYTSSTMRSGEYVLYTEPIPVSYDSTITAYAVVDGSKPSYTITRTYTKMPSDASLFTVDENGVLTGYSGDDKNPVVPNLINGVRVESIAKSAFSGNTNLQSVSVLTNTKTIEPDAFSGCTNLEYFRGVNVTSVGANVFKDCEKLLKVNSTNIEFIGDYAFYNCRNLRSMAFTKVSEVGDYAFDGCSFLTILGPNSITRLGDRAFAGTNFSSLTLNAVTEIGEGAFYGSKNFSSFTAPKLTAIYEGVFDGCDKLIEVNLDSVTTIGEEVFGGNANLESFHASKIVELPANAFKNCINLDDVVLGELKSIGAYAFYGTAIEEAVYNEAATVGDYAFAGCENLKEISLNKVADINETVFENCKKLQNVSLDSVSVIDLYFLGKSSETIENLSFNSAKEFLYDESMGAFALDEIFPNIKSFSAVKLEVVPDNTFKNCDYTVDFNMTELRVVGDYAFYGTDIEKVESQKLESVGKHAFNKCSKLTVVDGPKVSNVGVYAFANCPALKIIALDSIESFDISLVANSEALIEEISVNNAKSVTKNGEVVGFGDVFPKLTTLAINSLENVPDAFMNGAWNLSKLSIANVKTIGKNAFRGTAVTKLNLDGAESIGENAFADCILLTDFSANGITTYDFSILQGCTELTTLSINGVKSIKDGITETNNFGVYDNLNILHLNGLTSVPEYLCKDTTTLSKLYINGAETIAADAFYGNTSLVEISANAARTVGENAFSDCTSLVTISLASLEEIEEKLFYGNSTLKTVNIPGAKTIGAYAFADTAISKVKLENVETIGDYAFSYCALVEFKADKLTSMGTGVLEGTQTINKISVNSLPTLDSVKFFGTAKQDDLLHTYNLKSFTANKVKTIPREFFRSMKITDGEFDSVETIGYQAFAYSNIERLSVPSLVTVNTQAFYNAYYLAEINLDTVKTIQGNAFQNCRTLKLKSTDLTELVTLGEYAFMGATKIAGVSLDLRSLEYVAQGGFHSFATSLKSGTIKMPNVIELKDVPDYGTVLIGSVTEVVDVGSDSAAVICAPVQNTVVKDYCAAYGLNYVEFNSKTGVKENVSSVGCGDYIRFAALGFDLEYQWYGAYKADLSDAELIDNMGPYDYTLDDDCYGDYLYIYCVATSTENGNVVEIPSRVCKVVENVLKFSDNSFVYSTWWEEDVVLTYVVGVTEDDFENVFDLPDGFTYKLVTSQENPIYYGTDTKIEIYSGEDLYYECPFIVMGDMDGDSFVDVIDASLVERSIGIEFPWSPEIAADIDRSDFIDASDYQAVVNMVLSA